MERMRKRFERRRVVRNLSHIFSSDGSFGFGLLGLEQGPHVHVALY